MRMFLKILGGLAILIALEYGAVRLAQRIAMPDIPEQVPAEIDWTGPRQQLCEVKRALLIIRYQTCYFLSPNKLEANRNVALEYLAPKSLINPARLIFSFDYLATETAHQKTLRRYYYLEHGVTND